MISFSTTGTHALLICIPFSIFAVGSFLWKPRLWLHSLPKDIISRAEPKTEQENRLTKRLLLPLVLIILPGLSIFSAWNAATTTATDLSFLGAVVHLYGIWIIVHVWDFVIIDCGAILIIDPAHPPIAGTEGAKGWSNYKFHFRALLRAIVMSAVFVIPAALIVSMVI
jgi:hypothetical protein